MMPWDFSVSLRSLEDVPIIAVFLIAAVIPVEESVVWASIVTPEYFARYAFLKAVTSFSIDVEPLIVIFPDSPEELGLFVAEGLLLFPLQPANKTTVSANAEVIAIILENLKHFIKLFLLILFSAKIKNIL